LRCSIVVMTFLALLIPCCKPAQQDKEQATLKQFIAIERWPGEGIPIIAWTSPESLMAVYAPPGSDTPAGYIVVEENQQLQWDQSLILVQKFGKLIILAPCSLSGQVYDSLQDNKLIGGKRVEFSFTPGTILEVVCYAAEGDYIFYYQKKYLEMSGSHDYQQMMTKPQTQWWIRLKEMQSPSLWVRVDGKKISVIDRNF
jgi:hypothetical protein